MDEHRLAPDRMGCTKEALWEKGLISDGFCRKTGDKQAHWYLED